MLTLALSAPASQITNSVNIITNPNLDFCLKRPGVAGAQSQFKSDEPIDYLFLTSSTNTVYLRKFPSGNFDFHLFDEAGKELSKTKAGLDLTGIPTNPQNRADLMSWKSSHFFPFFFGGYKVDGGNANYGSLFRPDDVFVITNKGVYVLEVQARLCVIMTNGVPDTKAMLDGRNATSTGVPFIKDFGVLTSPPLRVKVIKK